jgi:hypothetical protein
MYVGSCGSTCSFCLVVEQTAGVPQLLWTFADGNRNAGVDEDEWAAFLAAQVRFSVKTVVCSCVLRPTVVQLLAWFWEMSSLHSRRSCFLLAAGLARAPRRSPSVTCCINNVSCTDICGIVARVFQSTHRECNHELGAGHLGREFSDDPVRPRSTPSPCVVVATCPSPLSPRMCCGWLPSSQLRHCRSTTGVSSFRHRCRHKSG